MVYANSLFNDFIWDDAAVIVNNDFVKSWNNFPLIFQRRYLSHPLEVGFNLGTYNFGSGETSYRPIATTSYFIDYTLWKLNPFGYRLTNITLHIINAILIYSLLNIIFGDTIFAFFSTVLFAINPINVEVVNCTAFRPNILASLFSMLSVVFYFKYKLYRNNKKVIYLMLSLLSFLFALFSKEIAIMLPLLLILNDYYQSSLDYRRVLRNSRTYIPYFLLDFSYILFYFLVMRPQQKIFVSIGIYKRIIDMLSAFGIYIKSFLFPIDLLPLPPEILDVQNSYASIFISAIFIIFCTHLIFKMKHFKKLSFAILWFFIALLPVNNFLYSLRIPVAYRYLYIPIVGLSMLLSTALIKISEISSKLFYNKTIFSKVIITGTIIYFSIFTIFANASWRDDIFLSYSLLMKYPECYSSHANECATLLKLGSLEEAEKECNIVISENRNIVNPFILAMTYINLGQIYAINKKYDKAEESYLFALNLFPNSSRVNAEVGAFYGIRGLHEKALEYFNKSKRINSNYTPAYINSGVTYMFMNKLDEARREWLRALEIYPNCQEAKDSLGRLEAIFREKER